MSAKDLCALPYIEKLKRAGVVAFKIEGRNKEPEYVDTTVRVYRTALDKKLGEKEIKKGIKILSSVYNKGFSSGFLLDTPTADDFSKHEHSSATQKKRLVGKVEHYFSNQGVAVIKMLAGKLSIGEEVLILGKNIGVKRHKIERMEINHKPVKSVKKGKSVGIKIEGVKRGHDIYKILKR